MCDDKKKQTLVKLHRQFGHATADRLSQLLESAGNKDSEVREILQGIVDSCDVCLKYKKAVPRPVVGFPLASNYNETVAMDLHQLGENLWYLHIIDEFSRFSAGCIVESKKASEIVEKFIQHWIAIHGPPRRLYTDNGGEFNNAEFQDMAENFNIEVKTTPAFSPWSNGLIERHNQTLTDILLKIRLDTSLDWKTALCWALNAKNSLLNVHGYSPYQVAFGRNPNIPSVIRDELPALEGTTMSEVVAKHISALHATRKAFIESESSNRIRRALRKQVRQKEEKYFTGEKVYYKRPDSTKWKGPGTVIGQDGVVVFVRHGGLCVRVHQCRLQKLTTVDSSEKNEIENVSGVGKSTDQLGQQTDRTCELPEKQDVSDQDFSDIENSDTDDRVVDPVSTDSVNEHASGGVKLSTGNYVSFTLGDGEACVGRILGRAGKASGGNKSWYNVEYFQPTTKVGTQGSVNFSAVGQFEVMENYPPESTGDVDESVLLTGNISFDEAKAEELRNWKENSVYKTVRDTGQKCISTRWVCSLKEANDGSGVKPKARLVARGFEESELEELPKDSPTCSSESTRVVFSVLAQNRWTPHSMDIKTAFLQGSEIARDIYLRPPRETCANGVVWKLQKCVYGLADASLHWYKKVKDVMMQCGGKVAAVDPAVFYWHDDSGNLQGVLASHVDDFVWGGTSVFEETIVPRIRSAFNVGREEENTFCYVGMEVKTVGSDILLSQNIYAESLQEIEVAKVRYPQRESKLSKEESDRLRSKIGQILWIARQSRPDVMFDACRLASNLNCATVQTLVDANKVVRRIKSEHLDLKFQHLGDRGVELVVFSDSSLGNLPDGGTQGGHLILLMGEDGVFSPLAWNSKKIRRVVRSTLAGETLALADGIDSGVFLATLIGELTTGKPDPSCINIRCVTDNKSLYEAVRSTKHVSDKRLRLEISNIKELISSGQVIDLEWHRGQEQLSDCLTKKGASPKTLLDTLSEGAWHLNLQ